MASTRGLWAIAHRCEASSLRGIANCGVPYWALPAAEIIRIFTGAPGSATFSNRFTELVATARRKFTEAADWLALDPTAVTADTPVPFDIRQIWHQLDTENHETRKNKSDPSTACRIDPGDSATLRSAQFEAYSPGGQPPHQAPTYGVYGTTPDLLRLGLLDPGYVSSRNLRGNHMVAIHSLELCRNGSAASIPFRSLTSAEFVSRCRSRHRRGPQSTLRGLATRRAGWTRDRASKPSFCRVGGSSPVPWR